MAYYYITIGKNEYNVNLEGEQIKINGSPIAGMLKPINGSGLHLLQQGKKTFELFLDAIEGDNLEFLIAGRRILAKVETLQSRARRRKTSETSGALTAPMPGVLMSVLVEPGQKVSEGQTLAVLESMKMQMQLKAAQAGTVQKVFHQPGDQVEKGRAILQIA